MCLFCSEFDPDREPLRGGLEPRGGDLQLRLSPLLGHAQWTAHGRQKGTRMDIETKLLRYPIIAKPLSLGFNCQFNSKSVGTCSCIV